MNPSSVTRASKTPSPMATTATMTHEEALCRIGDPLRVLGHEVGDESLDPHVDELPEDTEHVVANNPAQLRLLLDAL
ncbi:MAG: hypothetical protein ABI183_16240 [Polyangiaceae bacterium]